MKEKIVFYIHRTGLLGYYINPICDYLSRQYDIIILHLDKCNGYTFAPKESPLYQLRDISDLNIKEIRELIKEINPQVFISPGFISIFELLMLRICKLQGIKTVYLEHGLYSKETASLPLGKLINKFGSTVSKNLYFLYRYSQLILFSGNIKKEVATFWGCFRKKQYYLSKFDKALFFSDYGFKKINEMFHYEEEDVDFICYPLAKTDEEFRFYQEIAKRPLSEEKKATYIHQSLILDNLVKWSYKDERNYILEIANKIKKYGYSLSIQLHPRSDFEMYKKLFTGTGIEVMRGMKREEFKNYSLIIGHYSTALLYPIFFRIPIMIVDYPGLMKAEESPFYPISCKLPIDNPKALMDQYDNFCNEYMGSGMCSFENISRILDKAIKS